MVSEALVLSTGEQIILTQVSVEASWHRIWEVRDIIVFDQAEHLRHQASHEQQIQQCRQQRTGLQRQRTVLQSRRSCRMHPGMASAHEPAAKADKESTGLIEPQAAAAPTAGLAVF